MRKLFIALFFFLATGIFAQQNSIPEGFVRINGGTFIMGSPASEPGRDDDETQHRVTVSSFYMGRYEVTQADYEKVMGTNPSTIKGPNLPVNNVSWFDAIEYCNRLSQREGLTPAYTISGSGDNRTVTWNRNANGYRLPTEAEWEYACRAGTTTRYWSGDNETTLVGKENVADLTLKDMLRDEMQQWTNIRDGYAATAAVGSFQANPWGLHDMHGNVSEWCWDWYGAYGTANQTDPVGAASGAYRVFRGGAWSDVGRYARSACRSYFYPYGRGDVLGFRLVRP